jgi:hypothetical protein
MAASSPLTNILRNEVVKLAFYFLKISGIPIILILIFNFFHQDVWAEKEEKNIGFVPVTLQSTQWTEKPMNRRGCQNFCWDGRFKSGYSLGHYKSIWFNLDRTTGQLFAWTMVFWTMSNTALVQFFTLLYHGKLRWIPTFCLLCTVYPIFYGFWAGFGYMNDRFDAMWYSQLYFTVTELGNAFLAFRFQDSSKVEDERGNQSLPGQRPLIVMAYWFIFCHALQHLWQGMSDNIWDNLFGGKGNMMRHARDFLFFSSDLGQCCSALVGIWTMVSPSRPANSSDAQTHADIEDSVNDNQKDKLSKRGFLASPAYTKTQFRRDSKYAIAYVASVLFLLRTWEYKKEG